MSIRKRVIPVLMLRNGALVKTFRFKDEKYVGDPMNAVKIFNEKKCNELMVLDIDASKKNTEPNYELIEKIAAECFMPVSYGGGIKNIEQIKKILRCGIEKVLINTSAISDLKLITEASNLFGSSAVIAGIDVKKKLLLGEKVFQHSTGKTIDKSPEEWAAKLAEAGAGEILLNDVDRDGMQTGYNLTLLKKIAARVHVPVIICGGASNVADLKAAVEAGASAVAAGSLFVFNGPHKAVLISYLNEEEMKWF